MATYSLTMCIVLGMSSHSSNAATMELVHTTVTMGKMLECNVALVYMIVRLSHDGSKDVLSVARYPPLSVHNNYSYQLSDHHANNTVGTFSG